MLTILSYEDALARAKLRNAPCEPVKSEPHIRGAATRRTNRLANDPILKAAGKV